MTNRNPEMPRVIAVANQKGGTGKSTVTVNLAVALGERGQRVLVVDLDPQADATTMLGVDPEQEPRTLYDVLTGGCEAAGATLSERAASVDLLVGSERMSEVELTLAGEMMRERYLADALTDHTPAYDLVLIDCPPNLGLLTVNAFVAAPEVLVVVSMTDRNAYKGAMALAATVTKLRAKKVDTEILGLLRNNVDHHRATYQLLNNALRDTGMPLLHSEIPMRASFQNAVTAGAPLLRFEPDSIGSQAVRKLARELEQTGQHTQRPVRAA